MITTQAEHLVEGWEGVVVVGAELLARSDADVVVHQRLSQALVAHDPAHHIRRVLEHVRPQYAELMLVLVALVVVLVAPYEEVCELAVVLREELALLRAVHEETQQPCVVYKVPRRGCFA